MKVKLVSEGVHRCEYVTTAIGLHSVNIFFAGQSIPGSPFGVKVSPGEKRVKEILGVNRVKMMAERSLKTNLVESFKVNLSVQMVFVSELQSFFLFLDETKDGWNPVK